LGQLLADAPDGNSIVFLASLFDASSGEVNFATPHELPEFSLDGQLLATYQGSLHFSGRYFDGTYPSGYSRL
jgi:hypothetical protein